MVIVPLDSSFGSKTSQDQQNIIADLQMHSGASGLAGIVVPVWDAGGGRMAFIAPRQWHSFFASLTLRLVFANINKELSW